MVGTPPRPVGPARCRPRTLRPGIIPAFGSGPKTWTATYPCRASDRPVAEVIPLSGHDPTAQFEDELPLRQFGGCQAR